MLGNNFREFTKDLYRSRNGIFLGVCKGIAQWRALPVGVIRLIVIIIFIMSGFFPIGVLYIVAGILMKPEPLVKFTNNEEKEFYDSYLYTKSYTLNTLKKNFDRLDRRIRNMENTVTNKEYNWDQKFRESTK